MKKYIVPELDVLYCETQVVMTSIDNEDADKLLKKIKGEKVNQAKLQNIILQYFKNQVFQQNKSKVEEENNE